ncbi:dihydropteroate synthase [uncultured Arcticibacterium sp.]|uniref:dihydropteroate synthase n=1 Tax=uncultured Arcticibacterium sp. TaxID=2173042 RepID=UPI0030F81D17
MRNWINIEGKLVNMEQPKIMGILNATPDSFYQKSKISLSGSLEQKVVGMIAEGVDILDIGGYSTRPGADEVGTNEELDRVLPIIEFIHARWPEIMVSIDTFRSDVAKAAVGLGANIINDVSGGVLDSKMYQTVAELSVPYILMHMRGTPKTMKSLAIYDNVALEVLKELQSKVFELDILGVKDIIIDPGFGFSKSLKQNYELLEHLDIFKSLELPLLVGLSRKRMIWEYLNISPEDSLNSTTALNVKAIIKGASILRVHDVKQAVELKKVIFEKAWSL